MTALSIALLGMSALAFLGFKDWVALERQRFQASLPSPSKRAEVPPVFNEKIEALREDVERCKLALKIRTFPIGSNSGGK